MSKEPDRRKAYAESAENWQEMEDWEALSPSLGQGFRPQMLLFLFLPAGSPDSEREPCSITRGCGLPWAPSLPRPSLRPWLPLALTVAPQESPHARVRCSGDFHRFAVGTATSQRDAGASTARQPRGAVAGRGRCGCLAMSMALPPARPPPSPAVGTGTASLGTASLGMVSLGTAPAGTPPALHGKPSRHEVRARPVAHSVDSQRCKTSFPKQRVFAGVWTWEQSVQVGKHCHEVPQKCSVPR